MAGLHLVLSKGVASFHKTQKKRSWKLRRVLKYMLNPLWALVGQENGSGDTFWAGSPVIPWEQHFPPAPLLVLWGSPGLEMLVFSGSGHLTFLLLWQRAGSRSLPGNLHSSLGTKRPFMLFTGSSPSLAGEEGAEQIHWKPQRPQMLQCEDQRRRCLDVLQPF